jgi:hypothetical protein
VTLKAIALRVCTTALFLCVLIPTARAQQSGDCASIQMTSSVAVSTDPGFEGLYKYTITGSWDVTKFGLSHLDIFIMLQNCACKCDNRIFKFASPAGTSSGMSISTGSLCTATYAGEYLCNRDPSIPIELAGPTIKFDDIEDDCKTLTAGAGTWSFYSPFPPAPYSVYADAVAIKHGQGTCTGDLSGVLPVCDCSVPAAPATWGHVKSVYR